MFIQNDDGSYLDLVSGETITHEQYIAREPLHKIVQKNGFVGSTTRQNIIRNKKLQSFPHTGSSHTSYNFHPSQSSLINKSIESLATRHTTNNGFFIRILISDPNGQAYFVQTSSYDDVNLLMNEFVQMMGTLSLYGGQKVESISFVVRN